MGKLPLSVITITRNTEDTLEDCLKSVQKNNPSEIIIIDGNSGDRTLEIARRYTDRIYADEGKGKSYARQLGAEVASQTYIAYVDADIVLPGDTLVTMLKEIEGSDYIAMSAQMLLGENYRNYWGSAGLQHNQFSQRRRKMEFLATAACLLRKETLLQYKFDVTPGGYLDDMLLESKLRRAGHRLGASSAIVYHNHKTDFKSFVSYRFFLGSLSPSLIREQGIWHAGLWPPVYTFYWFGYCIVRGKWKLLPYFIVNGLVQTAGMVKGCFDLLKRRKK